MKQVLPQYLLGYPNSPDDETMRPVFDRLNDISAKCGPKAARHAAVLQMAALVIWLEEVCGTAATYEFLQRTADTVAKPMLTPAE